MKFNREAFVNGSLGFVMALFVFFLGGMIYDHSYGIIYNQGFNAGYECGQAKREYEEKYSELRACGRLKTEGYYK